MNTLNAKCLFFSLLRKYWEHLPSKERKVELNRDIFTNRHTKDR